MEEKRRHARNTPQNKESKKALVRKNTANINSLRVKRERIGKTFSGKRKSIRQAV